MKNYLKKIYKYWMVFVRFLSKVNGMIILTLLFFALFGFYSIIIRLKNLFLKRPSLIKQTFWLEKKYIEPDIEILKRQF